MAKRKEEKTNVMRILDQRAIPYTAHFYQEDQGPEGTRTGTASGVDGSFALLVSGDDGSEHTVNSGTVTML